MITDVNGNRVEYDFLPKISYLSILFLTVIGIAMVPMFVFLPLSIIGIVIMTVISLPAIYIPYWRTHKEDINLDVTIRLFGFGMIPGFLFTCLLNAIFFLLCMVVCFPLQTESLTDFFANYSWRADPISMLTIEKNFSYYLFVVLTCIFARSVPLVFMLYLSIPLIKHSLRSIHVQNQPKPFAYSVYFTATILATTIVQMIVDSFDGNTIETAAVASTLMLTIYTILCHLVNVEIVQKGIPFTFIDSFTADISSEDGYPLQYIESGLIVILSIYFLWYIRSKLIILTNDETDLMPIVQNGRPIHISIPNDVVPSPSLPMDHSKSQSYINTTTNTTNTTTTTTKTV